MATKKVKSVRIPITAAREIGKNYSKDQVILVTWDKTTGDTWVTTWGKTQDDCSMAAEGGNFVKKALGWPNELTQDVPAREKKLEKKIREKLLNELKDKFSKLDVDNYVGLNTYAQRDINEVLEKMKNE